MSKPNDAISLALHPEKRLSTLDLWGVAEFKKGSNGVIEIKFTDRVKAISLLLEALGGSEDGMAALLDACLLYTSRALAAPPGDIQSPHPVPDSFSVPLWRGSGQ